MIKLFIFCALLVTGLVNTFSQDKNWTHFRGSNLNGISTEAKLLLSGLTPILNGKQKSMGKDIPPRLVYDNQIWVTTATLDGKELYAVCIDFTDRENYV